MATRADLHTQLRDHASMEFATSILSDTRLDTFLNAAIERIQSARDWKGQEGSADFVYTATTDGLVLPGDFITEERVSEVGTQSDPSLNLSPLPKVQRGEWVQRAGAPSTSRTFPTPSLTGRYYYLFAQQLFIVPNPSTDIIIRLDYVATLADLSASVTENFFTLFHPALVKWGALSELYAFLHEEERINVCEQMFQRYFDAARRADVSAKTGGDAPRTRGV